MLSPRPHLLPLLAPPERSESLSLDPASRSSRPTFPSSPPPSAAREAVQPRAPADPAVARSSVLPPFVPAPPPEIPWSGDPSSSVPSPSSPGFSSARVRTSPLHSVSRGCSVAVALLPALLLCMELHHLPGLGSGWFPPTQSPSRGRRLHLRRISRRCKPLPRLCFVRAGWRTRLCSPASTSAKSLLPTSVFSAHRVSISARSLARA